MDTNRHESGNSDTVNTLLLPIHRMRSFATNEGNDLSAGALAKVEG
jgi:hypothetical protein